MSKMRTAALVISILAGVLVLSVIVMFGWSGESTAINDANCELSAKSPRTIYVGSGPGNDSATIQGGIYLASAGDTVFVWSGTYYEAVKIEYRENRTLIGENKATTIIDGGGACFDVVYISAGFTRVINLTITGSGLMDVSAGIAIARSSNVIITNCNISNNNIGVRFEGGASNGSIADCKISSNSNCGIDIYYSPNTTVKNCTVSNNWNGIYLCLSPNSTIINCNISSNNGLGIYLYATSEDTITNCHLFSNSIQIASNQKQDFNHTIDTSNTMNGKPIYYYFDLDNTTVENLDVGYISLAWCANVTLKNCKVINGDALYLLYTWQSIVESCELSNNSKGVTIWCSSNNTVKNCNISSNGYGIYFQDPSSNSNTITDCNISSNKYDGISFHDSTNNTIQNCHISNNGEHGVELFFSPYNTIKYCNIFGNDDNGIYVYYYSNNNTVNNCNIESNNNSGIKVATTSNPSTNNSIYCNNFINNTQNAYDECGNYWDNGKEGNYWSDYTGSDADNDWIGDTAYSISGGSNKDDYPLMYPYPVGNPSKSKGYSSIQGAIDDASAGDTVYVWNGTYYENVIINKTISLVGRDRNTTIIDGNGTGDVIYINANYVNISELMIQNSGNSTWWYYYDAGLDIRSSCNTIINCIILKNAYGIFICESSNNSIHACTISDNSYGIFISSSFNNNLRNNNIFNNSYNLGVSGWGVSAFYQDIDVSNTVSNMPIYYLVEQNNLALDCNSISIGYLALISCNNITIRNLNMSYNYQGIMFANTTRATIINCIISNNFYGIHFNVGSDNNTITNCTVSNNSRGVQLYESSDNIISYCNAVHNLVGVYFCYSNNTLISNCTLVNGGTGIICGHYSSRNVILNCYVMDNSEGIALSPESSNTTLVDCNILNGYAGIDISSSSNNTILKCNILNATFGIDLSLSCNNIISDCNLSSGYEGILLADCSNNTILYSSISNYTCRGFELVHSSNNTIDSCIISNNQLGIELRSYSNNNSIRHNNFINNTLNGYDTCSNYWDDGSEGNHWSDYNGTDANNDRIGDTPYNIPGGVNKDNYPLMYPWGAIPPIANFTFLPSLPTAIDRIEFNGALSKDLDGAIACWLWSFGDSTNSTLQNPTHKYPKRGSYQVKLTVWDNDGANHTTTKTIIILNSQPILSNITLSPKTGTPDTEFTFRITYSDADGDEPLYMRIVIDNVPYDMTKVEGDYVTGVVYEYKTKLSAGLHRYKFECDDGSGEVTSFVSTSVESLSVEEKPIPYLILISTVVVLIIIGVLLAVWLRKKKSKIP